ncbi:hypothetical protein JCM10914A_42030 [Paenibacillus sp. JCM 10914]|uniref:hypothetical protein n=1 Tax=Paenibacillus sp. JCM 10914 TaxID=1236974 RepID=UPI0003CC6A70|nr:hypothetical protein [Paenibacillus sp. JCM 10914]GAE05419.1 hypothetical protein JCM10914_1518 [Paenibacillus sp. JCM 10914]
MVAINRIFRFLWVVCLLLLSACQNERPSIQEATGSSLAHIVERSKTGELWSWADFEDYPYEDIGSGLYVRQYELDGHYRLIVSGRSLKENPSRIFLINQDGDEIDLQVGR